MTRQEKIIVSAYTGTLMCDFVDVHEYIEKKLGRPVYTHELADKNIWEEIKEKSKEDFLELCKREDPERKEDRWIPTSKKLPEDDTEVIVSCTDDSGDSEFSYTTTGWHFKGLWVVGNERSCFVTAWMSLPEPYEERRGNDGKNGI